MLALPMATTWRRRRSPSPDVMDDVARALSEGEVPTETPGRRAKAAPDEGRVRPGTKEGRSRSHSPSSEDPTRHTRHIRELSSKRPVAREMQLYKLRPPPGSTAVGRRRRRCRSPKVDGGRLQKAAPEASLASKKDLLALPPH
jgi:hypothetical protein